MRIKIEPRFQAEERSLGPTTIKMRRGQILPSISDTLLAKPGGVPKKKRSRAAERLGESRLALFLGAGPHFFAVR
jgi:hypothetical protein